MQINMSASFTSTVIRAQHAESGAIGSPVGALTFFDNSVTPRLFLILMTAAAHRISPELQHNDSVRLSYSD